MPRTYSIWINVRYLFHLMIQLFLLFKIISQYLSTDCWFDEFLKEMSQVFENMLKEINLRCFIWLEISLFSIIKISVMNWRESDFMFYFFRPSFSKSIDIRNSTLIRSIIFNKKKGKPSYHQLEWMMHLYTYS